MRARRITATAVLAVAAVGLGAGVAPAQPADPQENNPLALHGNGYEVSASPDHRAIVATLRDGRFDLIEDGRIVTVLDRDGRVLAALPMAVRVGDKRVDVRPELDAAGTTLTLGPVAASDIPLRDISAQERFFEAVERNLAQVAGGIAIGAAIGFLLGFPLGLFIFDIVTVPITTVVGGVIGAFAGLYAGGGQEAVDAALAYLQGAP